MRRSLCAVALFVCVSSQCVVNQTCVGYGPSMQCGPNFKVDPPFQPQIQRFTPPVMCPEFEDTPVCCFNYDNYQLIGQFQELDYTFGGANGGCDVCAANMKRFWCYFVCAPNQAEFLSIGNYTWVQNPVNPGQMIQVLEINFTVTNELACNMYESCKKCPYTQQLSSLQSAQGFLQFQGTNSAIGGELITFFFQEQSIGALGITMVPCNYNRDQLAGISIQPCSCNNCGSACTAKAPTPSTAVMHGVDWMLVGVGYLGVLLVTMILFFFRLVWEKRKQAQKLATRTRMDLGLMEAEE